MVREAVVGGQFYSADKEGLLAELKGLVPPKAEKIDALGIMVPHAGYMYSGRVAGAVYGRIKPKSTYVIFGPNHTGRGARFASSGDLWQTPLGELLPDTELLENILARTNLITEDAAAHSVEHSIEVQLPFIQRTASSAKIVPIAAGHGNIEELSEIAEAVSSAVKETSRDAVLVASSDMTHYENREAVVQKDKKAIQKVLELDAEGLVEVVEKNNISMCGCIPTAIMLMAAGKLGAKKGRLIEYTDSGEVTGDISQVVGYAGMVVS
ncbi:MAG: AmmeMemoRadiSam system protein B [Candidatus Omnitrophica bacterium]|nr:AmmeMemoRadiSam system protein B [Candidatus Omnitrophota bacterium]